MDEQIPQASSTLPPQEGDEQQSLTRKERKALRRTQKQENKVFINEINKPRNGRFGEV